MKMLQKYEDKSKIYLEFPPLEISSTNFVLTILLGIILHIYTQVQFYKDAILISCFNSLLPLFIKLPTVSNQINLQIIMLTFLNVYKYTRNLMYILHSSLYTQVFFGDLYMNIDLHMYMFVFVCIYKNKII